MNEVECSCSCHGQGVYGTCDIEGGCGSVGCVNGRLDRAAPDDHRCARGDRCKGRIPERTDSGATTGVWIPATITAARGLCDACVRDVEHALNHLTGDVVELTMIIGGGDGRTDGNRVRGTRELPIPIRTAIEALRAEIDSELQAWAEPVAEKLGVEWDTEDMRRTRMAPRVQRAAHLLTRAVDTLIALPDQEHPAWNDDGTPAWDHDLDCQDTRVRDGLAGALDFIELHRRAYAALGRSRLVHRLPTPCPYCDYLALVRENGGDEVVCENCHKAIQERHYSWFVEVLVREQQRHAQVA